MSLTIDERLEIREFIIHLKNIKPNRFTWTPAEDMAYDLFTKLYNNDNKRLKE